MAERRTKTETDLAAKVPSHSLEAEKSVLGCILIDKDAFIKIADLLTKDDFYYESHARIYQTMEELYRKRMPIDLLTTADFLKDKKQLEEIGGRSYLAELANEVPTATHIFQYATIVKHKATLRRLLKAGHTIVDLSYNETSELEEVLEEAEKNLFSVSQTFLKERFIPIKEILNQTYEKISDLHDPEGKEKYRGTPTGFRSLDNLLSGLQPSDLIVISGRPSMGKTSLALNIVQNVAKQGKSVGIISLEMSKEQLVERLFCALLAVDSWKLRTGKLTEDDFGRIGAVMDELNQAKIFIDDSPGHTLVELRAKARRLQMEYGLDLLVVDYLQLMSIGKPTPLVTNRVQEISEISRTLKALARELRIPIIALSQLSRAVEQRPSKIPQLSDLRESGCLTGDTLILRADTGAQVPLKTLIGTKPPIPTLALNGHLNLEIHPITKVFSSGWKMVYELKTATGRTIKASGNHPFYTLQGWKRLDQLQVKESIAVPSSLPEPVCPESEDKNKLIILAHLIGDGCYLKRQPLHYTNSDSLCLGAVSRAAKKAFNINSRLVKQENWYHLYLPQKGLTHGKRNPIVKWLDEELGIFDQRSPQKVIPQMVFPLPKKDLAFFLKHLWATDGSISLNQSQKGGNARLRIFYATKNRVMAAQIQYLLLRFGIVSRLVINRKKGYQPGWLVDISGREYQMRFLKEIGIFGRKAEKVKEAIDFLKKIKANPNKGVIPKAIWPEIGKIKEKYGFSWRDFARELGMSYCGSSLFKNGISKERLRRITKFMPEERLITLSNSHVYWDEIISIKKLAKEEVFDATVPGPHNFLANNIIVHNSIEQDADVVLMIYREDYYEEDTDRVGITDIFIRKHRNGPTGRIELMFKKEQMKFYDIDKQRTLEYTPVPTGA